MRHIRICGFPALSMALFLALVGAQAQTQTVETRDRNVIFTGADGRKLQLTDSHEDLFPELSSDGALVAFVRIGSSGPPGGFEGPETHELCVMRVGLGNTPMCASVSYRAEEDPLAGFHGLTWTPDGKSVYFLADFSSRRAALCRFDIAAGEASFLKPVASFGIASAGRWSGLPVASISTGTAPESGSAYYVLSSEGEALSRVGDEAEELEAVIARVERAEPGQ